MSPLYNESTSRPSRRNISWLKAAKKEFEAFPNSVQEEMKDALTVVAEGKKPKTAKPIKGLGSGVYEIAISDSGNAYRTVYTIQILDDIWVIHAFMKKSKSGIKTPIFEINLVRNRIKKLKEALL